MIENTLHNGIWVKVFDFWFHFMEKKRFAMFIRVIYRDGKANMTYITLLFDRTERNKGILGLQKTYFSW